MCSSLRSGYLLPIPAFHERNFPKQHFWPFCGPFTHITSKEVNYLLVGKPERIICKPVPRMASAARVSVPPPRNGRPAPTSTPSSGLQKAAALGCHPVLYP